MALRSLSAATHGPARGRKTSTSSWRRLRSTRTRCSARCCCRRQTPATIGSLNEWLAATDAQGHRAAGRRQGLGFRPSFRRARDLSAGREHDGGADGVDDLGKAFTADRSGVFASIQRLRAKAQPGRQAEEQRRSRRSRRRRRERRAGDRHRAGEPASRLRAAIQRADGLHVAIDGRDAGGRRQRGRGRGGPDWLHGRHRARRRHGQRLLLRPHGWRGGGSCTTTRGTTMTTSAKTRAKTGWTTARTSRRNAEIAAQHRRSSGPSAQVAHRRPATELRPAAQDGRQRAPSAQRQRHRAGTATSSGTRKSAESRGYSRMRQGPEPQRRSPGRVLRLLERQVRARRELARREQPQQLARWRWAAAVAPPVRRRGRQRDDHAQPRSTRAGRPVPPVRRLCLHHARVGEHVARAHSPRRSPPCWHSTGRQGRRTRRGSRQSSARRSGPRRFLSDPATRRNQRSSPSRLVEPAASRRGPSNELVIGHEEWPFPIPLVKRPEGSGATTPPRARRILARRIGRNELAAIRISGACVLRSVCSEIRARRNRPVSTRVPFAATARPERPLLAGSARGNGAARSEICSRRRRSKPALVGANAEPQPFPRLLLPDPDRFSFSLLPFPSSFPSPSFCSPSGRASGAPCARTTARTATPGTTSRTTRRAPRLPVGRGRPRRDLRRPAAALLRAGAVERAGPDPQGAAVRPDEQRGQPRRGRQGVLLLSRLDADALLHEVSLQVPAGGVPLYAIWSRPTRAAAGWSSSTSCSTRASSTSDRYFDVFVEYAKASPEDILIRSRSPIAGPSRRRCTCCRRSGSATPGRGGRGPPARLRPVDGQRRGAAHPELGERVFCTPTGRPRCCSPRTRPTRSALRRSPNRRRT